MSDELPSAAELRASLRDEIGRLRAEIARLSAENNRMIGALVNVRAWMDQIDPREIKIPLILDEIVDAAIPPVECEVCGTKSNVHEENEHNEYNRNWC